MLYILFLAVSVLIALLGMQFWRGKWLEYITLIDINRYDRKILSKISAIVCFTIALAFSLFAAGVLLEMVDEFAIVTIAVCIVTIFVGYYLIFAKAKKRTSPNKHR
ncbi:MAG: hypothetical protein AB7V07_03365 [Candidatus Delongbacteria bacterium]